MHLKVLGLILVAGSNLIAAAPLAKTQKSEIEQEQTTFISPETTRYWKFHNWAAVGYRYDRQHFHEFSTTSSVFNSKLNMHGRSSAFLMLGNHAEFKNFLLIIRGTYGWLAYGRVNYDLPGNYGAEPVTFDRFKDASGYSAEGQGSLSYIFNLYGGTNAKFVFDLIPGIGYRYFHLMDYPSGVKTYDIPPGAAPLAAGTTGYARASFTRPIQQDWFGPFFEGRVLCRVFQKYQFEFFYQYHLPSLRMVNSTEINTYLFNPASSLVQTERQRYHNVVQGNALRTQLGGTDLRVHGTEAWTFGAHFEGAVTWSDTNKYLVKQSNQNWITNEGLSSYSFVDRMAIHWVNYMTYAYVGFRF